MSTIKVASISHPSSNNAAIKLASDGTAGIAALTTNAQSGTTYTFTADDAGRLVTASNASAKTFTIPPQSSVTWAAGAVLNVVNYGAGSLTVAGGAGVTVTNAAKTSAQFESAALIRTAENAWTLVPFSGGVGNADFSDAATGTYTDGGINYKYKTYTGSGSLTVTTSGLATMLIIAGGAGGAGGAANSTRGAGGGGAGGFIQSQVYLTAGMVLPITVGAGGAFGAGGGLGTNGSNGNGSFFPNGYMGGGGGGGAQTNSGLNGFSGGGSGNLGGAGGTGQAGFGNNGGTGSGGVAGGSGGGGAGGVGQTTSTAAGGAGGTGLASLITNTSVTYSVGGAGGPYVGGTGASAGANTGGGGDGAGGTGSGSFNGGNGGSGIVIIRVRTN